jgi:hypothetical protein
MTQSNAMNAPGPTHGPYILRNSGGGDAPAKQDEAIEKRDDDAAEMEELGIEEEDASVEDAGLRNGPGTATPAP